MEKFWTQSIREQLTCPVKLPCQKLTAVSVLYVQELFLALVDTIYTQRVPRRFSKDHVPILDYG